ncbi:hypothetical protein [Streptomyces beihaiensis]|uniref:J domain-containing protein n=1 Tax=Streptomyces beihaiensis TaxID=2984495 RepID=A0ABT3TRK2_9ACTN|nr:hypothetical protein [Streptomyces beihaiensis]MCX3059664.1 hypothetical protein [Streptomyces beihaiensis]
MTTADHHTRHRRPNPFQVLGLPVDADQQSIVERAEDGIRTAGSDQERALYDWAMRELIGHPRTRQRHALTEPPGTEYRDRALDAFARRHRPNPADLRGHRLSADDFDLPEAVRRVVRELHKSVPEAGLHALERQRPHATDTELEARDVLFG